MSNKIYYKIICFLSLLLFILGFSQWIYALTHYNNDEYTDDVYTEEPEEKREFTLMLYVCGSDLESDDSRATTNIMQILSGAEKLSYEEFNKLNIFIQTGGARNWDEKLGIDPEKTDRYIVARENNKIILKLVQQLPEQNMGEAQTLADFVYTGITYFPASQYGLVFWDHGGGPIEGLCLDERFSDSLTLAEIDESLTEVIKSTNFTEKFLFTGFDTCLTAFVETASLFSKYSKTLYASQDLEPGEGWDYIPFIEALAKKHATKKDALEVGKVIADSYMASSRKSIEDSLVEIDEDSLVETEVSEEEISGLVDAYLGSVTFSVSDLDSISDLNNSIENLVSKMNEDMQKEDLYTDIIRSRNAIKEFQEIKLLTGEDSDFVDILSLAQEYSQEYPSETESIKNALNSVVYYRINSNEAKEAGGLSIYFPFRNRNNFESNLEAYKNSRYNSKYIDFVTKLANSVKDIYVDSFDKDFEVTKEAGQEYIVLNDEQVSNMSDIYQVDYKVDPQNPQKITMISYMQREIVEGNKIEKDFYGRSFYLGDQLMPVYTKKDNDGNDEIEIPVIHNDIEKIMSIELDMDDDFVVTQLQVPGSYDFETLQEGDKLCFYFKSFIISEDNGVTSLEYSGRRILGKEFIYDPQKQEINIKDLPNGKYKLGYEVVDLFSSRHDCNFEDYIIDAQ